MVARPDITARVLLILIAFGIAATGCYTVRPSAGAALERRRLPRVTATVAVVLDEALRGYRSLDRGHQYADVQTYELGPGITEGLQRNYRTAFERVVSGPSEVDLARQGPFDVLVHPRVRNFVNRISFVQARQTVRLELEASVRIPGRAELELLRVNSSATRKISRLGYDGDGMTRMIEGLIEQVAFRLVEETAALVEARGRLDGHAGPSAGAHVDAIN